MKYFALTILLFLACSCTSVQAKRLSNGITKVQDIVENVCLAAPLFDAIDAARPAVEGCEKALRVLDHDGYVAVIRALDCAKNTPSRSAEMLACIDDIDGWKIVAEKLNR